MCITVSVHLYVGMCACHCVMCQHACRYYQYMSIIVGMCVDVVGMCVLVGTSVFVSTCV